MAKARPSPNPKNFPSASPMLSRRRLWLLVAAAVLAFAAVSVAFVWPRFQAQHERQEALALSQRGQFAQAEPLLRRAAERNPDDLDVLKALARGLLATESSAEAESYLTRWCTLRPTDAEPFKHRMAFRHQRARRTRTIAEQQRGMEEALTDGQHALELDPNDDPLAQEVVWLLLQVGRFEEADQLCRRCLARQPRNPWLVYLLAKICHARGAAAEAQTLLDPLLREYPDNTLGLLLRAVLYREADQPAQAIPLLRRLLDLNRDHQQEARYQLSLALAQTGQTDEAQRVMAEFQKKSFDQLLATASNPDTLAVQAQTAEAQLAAGQTEEALAVLAKILEQDPGFAPAHRLLAVYYDKQGQPARAAEHWRRAGSR